MARQILGAVNYLHAKGMTHHDIAVRLINNLTLFLYMYDNKLTLSN